MDGQERILAAKPRKILLTQEISVREDKVLHRGTLIRPERGKNAAEAHSNPRSRQKQVRVQLACC